MPASIWLLEPPLAQLLLVGAFLSVIAFEITRRQPILIGQFANRVLAPTLRPSELNGKVRLTGAFYMLVGALLTSLLFSKEIAATALAVLMISDSLAALVGKRWGNHSFAGKSVEGSAAFLISAIAITCLSGFVSSIPFLAFFTSGVVACLIATLCELYAPRMRLDDNLLIPLSFALTHTLTLQLILNEAFL